MKVEIILGASERNLLRRIQENAQWRTRHDKEVHGLCTDIDGSILTGKTRIGWIKNKEENRGRKNIRQSTNRDPADK